MTRLKCLTFKKKEFNMNSLKYLEMLKFQGEGMPKNFMKLKDLNYKVLY